MDHHLKQADTVIKNVKVFNSYFRKFFSADVYIKEISKTDIYIKFRIENPDLLILSFHEDESGSKNKQGEK